MDETFQQRLEAIDWASYETAYGSAVKVPGQLLRLASDNPQEARAASHELWCGLCHQHAYVSSAALPALPFILEVLDRADDLLTIEILDILLGFAFCAGPRSRFGFSDWSDQLWERLAEELHRFHALESNPNEHIAYFARKIVAEYARKGRERSRGR